MNSHACQAKWQNADDASAHLLAALRLAACDHRARLLQRCIALVKQGLIWDCTGGRLDQGRLQRCEQYHIDVKLSREPRWMAACICSTHCSISVNTQRNQMSDAYGGICKAAGPFTPCLVCRAANSCSSTLNPQTGSVRQVPS